MWSVSTKHLHWHAQFLYPTPKLSDSSDNRAPTLAATMSAHVGWQQRQRGGGGWLAGWGGLLQDGDSYWVFERWARSSHLPTSSIMPRKWTQIKRTHSCLSSHYHIQALCRLFSASLSKCEPRPWGKERGAEFRLSLAPGGHGSARRKSQVVSWLMPPVWAKMMGCNGAVRQWKKKRGLNRKQVNLHCILLFS